MQECIVGDDTIIREDSEVKPWALVNKQSIARMDLPNEISKDDDDSSSSDPDLSEEDEEGSDHGPGVEGGDIDDVVGIQDKDFTSTK